MEETIRDNTNLLFPISYSLFPKEGNLLFPIKVWKTVPNSRKHQYIKTKYQWIKIFFLFLSIDIFYCLAFLEYSSHALIMYIMCSSLRDDHKRSKRTRIALMRRICSFTDFYSMHLDYVRHWRMDSYGFSLRLRQSSAVRRKEIRNKSKSK